MIKKILTALLVVAVFSAPICCSHALARTKKIERYKLGRIKRSAAQRRKFMIKTGHPHGWKGHEVHHKIPLYKGGSDTPRNMKWVTVKQHRKAHRRR